MYIKKNKTIHHIGVGYDSANTAFRVVVVVVVVV